MPRRGGSIFEEKVRWGRPFAFCADLCGKAWHSSCKQVLALRDGQKSQLFRLTGHSSLSANKLSAFESHHIYLPLMKKRAGNLNSGSIGLAEVHRIESVSLVFGHDESLLRFFFHHKYPRLRSSEAELLQEAHSLSPEACVKIKVALDLWSCSGGVTFNEILRILDDDALLWVISSILKFREIEKEALLSGESC